MKCKRLGFVSRSLVTGIYLGALASLVACGGGSGGTAAAPGVQPLACDDTMKTAFKPDASTSVLLVKQVKKGEDLLKVFPDTAVPLVDMQQNTVAGNDMCVVKLLVGPGNAGPAEAPSTSSGIGIEVFLPAPANWNSRVHVLGSGDYAGGSHTKLTALGSTRGYPVSAWGIAGNEGAVSATNDTGHIPMNGSALMNPDGSINTVGWKDFSERGIHEMAVKTKALASAFYGTAPKYSYFHGISTGGRQAMKLAQAYPEDFDGILAGMPAINWTKVISSILWPHIVYERDLAGVALTTPQLTLVSNAATAACDLVGGEHLGYVPDPSQCRYDPVKDPSVLCTASGGTNSTANCLSTAQARAVNKIWYGPTTDGSVPDPAVDNGFSTTLAGQQKWYGITRGTRLGIAAAPSALSADQVALELQDPTLAGTTFLNATGNGQSRWRSLSYAAYANAFDRGVALQSAFANIDTDNPDLSRFKARNGKLIMYHGLADTTLWPQGTIQYYNRVANAMGGMESIQSFYRFYLVPGLGHLWGQVNGTYNAGAPIPLPVDSQWYAAITDWVEKGAAPSDITVKSTPASTQPERSSVLCTYPKKLIYVSGDPKQSTSYRCN